MKTAGVEKQHRNKGLFAKSQASLDLKTTTTYEERSNHRLSYKYLLNNTEKDVGSQDLVNDERLIDRQ